MVDRDGPLDLTILLQHRRIQMRTPAEAALTAAGCTVHVSSDGIQGLTQLMYLSDNDLLDLLLRRKEPADDLDSPDVREVLGMLRTQPPGDTATQRSTANPQGNPT